MVQRLTLPLLIRLLKIKPQDNLQKGEEKDFHLKITKSVLNFIDHEFPFKPDKKVLSQIRKPYEANFKLLSKELSDDDNELQQNSQQVMKKDINL